MFIGISIPVEKIKAIADATKAALDGYRTINKTISELPVISKEMDGQRAVDARKAKLEEFEAQKANLLQLAKEAIDPMIDECMAEIDAQTTPSGEEVERNKDYALFRYGTITSPDQLTRLIEKNKTLVFALNAEKYAKDRGWGSDFDVLTDEGAVRDFCNEVANVCRKALEFPGGYFDAYASDDSFLEKMAAAYGVLKSYSAQTEEGNYPEASDNVQPIIDLSGYKFGDVEDGYKVTPIP